MYCNVLVHILCKSICIPSRWLVGCHYHLSLPTPGDFLSRDHTPTSPPIPPWNPAKCSLKGASTLPSPSDYSCMAKYVQIDQRVERERERARMEYRVVKYWVTVYERWLISRSIYIFFMFCITSINIKTERQTDKSIERQTDTDK